ncbi:uncharacterized protein LOC135700859 [Ochlerotatus camptorhynchus]|uniref:uncharacterized protein LOC135700859 n=1 Tax=Ochlerotatus camptorhynchus TaxID=644619 RepID=UPI0031E0CB30
MKMFPAVVILVAMLVMSSEAVKPTSNVDFTDVEDSADGTGFVNVYRNYPKIQVTVDTSKLKRVSQPESEDSSSGSSGSSGSESVERPTVGVRTDITIEISEESLNETNTVDGKKDSGKRNGSSGKKDGKGVDDDDDDNASVPVFKGTAGVPTKGKTPKPTSPNDVNGKRPGVTMSSRPTTFVYKNDDRRPAGPYDGWNRFQPVTGLWTTERPYNRRVEYDYHGNPIYVKSYVPYQTHQTHQGHQPDSNGSWKPCYCNVYQQPWDRAPSNPVLPTPTHRRKVDDKVDIPYKQHRD